MKTEPPAKPDAIQEALATFLTAIGGDYPHREGVFDVARTISFWCEHYNVSPYQALSDRDAKVCIAARYFSDAALPVLMAADDVEAAAQEEREIVASVFGWDIAGQGEAMSGWLTMDPTEGEEAKH